MNTELLKHEDFGEIRVQQVDGQPWFVVKDVCDTLGLTNPSMAINHLKHDEIADLSSTDVRSDGVSQNRKLLMVNESGLYQLIFKSRKPQASEFN